MKTLLLVCCLAFPVRAQWLTKPDAPEIVMMGVAQALIVIDVALTLKTVDTGAVEINPLYGSYFPTRGRIIVTSAAIDLGFIGVWLAVPPRVRPYLTGIVIGLEGYIVYRNFQVTMNF